jgi:nuclear pore complex protein Nup93
MEELRLLPLNGDLPTIMQYCDDINNMDDAIVRNLPEFVLATMDAIYNIHRRFKESLYTDLGRQDVSCCA